MTSTAPLLLVIGGAGRGGSVSLDRSITIGRDPSAELAIADVALSRRHCAIEQVDGRSVLRDLGSRNGCFVNDRPVTSHVLQDGDQIRIGDSALLFVQPSDRAERGAALDACPLDETPLPAGNMLTIDPANTPKPARDLGMLLHLSDVVQRVSTTAALHDLLLREALAAVPSDGGAIMTAAEDSVAMSRTSTPSGRPITVSRTVASCAIKDRVAVLVNNLPADVRFQDAPSVSDGSVRAALCAPLLSREIAAIYLARAAGPPFTDEELHLIAAIGSIGGLALDRVSVIESLEAENRGLRGSINLEHALIGESAAMQTVYAFITKVAPTEATVLLRGESGTGKELVARALHTNSPRARGPFVAINCAAVPDALLESELFGHERGAFTGASAQQRGRLELANGGTVFLDEIGELVPSLQAKLLRALQDRVVERLGGRRSIPLDVRIIAATNRDLECAITDGSFRKDLYYRLNVVALTMPALRDRRDDIPLLANYFLRKYAARCKRVVRSISPAARRVLRAHDWPGNVRELENAIERAVVLGSSDIVEREDLPETLVERPEAASDDARFHASVAAYKRTIIREAIERAGGNVADAARALGLQPTYLHRLMTNLGVRDALRSDR